MIKVAITGNIASGKSKVGEIISDLGYKVYDADKIAHEILYSSNEVLEAFKDFDILENDKISRVKLGNIVFNNKGMKQKLEDIIHPQIRENLKEILKANKVGHKVFCDDEIRKTRLMKRNNLTTEQAIARINSQKSQDEKINLVDYVIKNESTIEVLKEQVKNCLINEQ